MKLKENKGAIIFYLVLVVCTLIIVYNNEKELNTDSGYVYLGN